MATKPDDLEAVRQIITTLEPFDSADRERIIRWAREKLGMPVTSAMPSVAVQPNPTPATETGHQAAIPPSIPSMPHLPTPHAPHRRPVDIKSFVQAKNPTSDNQFVATVAYYHQFEAPEADRKEYITS